MEYRISAYRKRFSIGALSAAVLAPCACTRGEQSAPPSGAAGQTTSSPAVAQQSKVAAEQSSTTAAQSSTAVGFDSLTKEERPGSTCYAGARYVIVERELETQVGADLYVRVRSPDAAPRCETDSTAGDIVFRTGEAAARHPDSQHFLGLKGDLLFAWDGTGAASDLYIYDLNKRAKALVIEDADEKVEWLSPTTPAIWVTKAYAQGAIAVGCPDTIPSMTPQMDSLMTIDLQTLKLRQTGKYRCIVSM